jgi:glycosyltransferase involved in cell wall biosynthesis
VFSPSISGIRICLATPLFYPSFGGAQLRYKRYLPKLREHGADVRVFAGTATPLDFTPQDAYERWSEHRLGRMLPVESVEGTPVHRVRLPDAKGLAHRTIFQHALCRFCRNRETRPDVLQLVGTIRIGAIPWIRQLRRMGIATLYSVTTASKVTRRVEGFDRRLFKFRTVFDSMDCIVTNSDHLRGMLREMGVTTRVEAISSGVDLTRFHADGSSGRPAEIRAQLGIGPHDPMIVSVGAVMARKGSDLLVEAFSRLARVHHDAHLVFVGPSQTGGEAHHRAFQDRLARLVDQSGVADKIHFVGLSDEVPEYLRAADVLALPSKREGLPNAVIEAMACRTPVVITPFDGLCDDLGKPDGEYLLADFDPASLASCLQRLIEEKPLAEAIARSGQELVHRSMSLEASVARYAELYGELAASSGFGDRGAVGPLAREN